MKYKNYTSTIHNFTHSFISVDYMKSGRLAVNVLIDLHNKGLKSKATFNFIKKTIKPIEAESNESLQLLNDYMDWLPKHFNNHQCDLEKLESLEITIWTDFKNTTPSERNKKERVFKISASTNWKVEQRANKLLEISQLEFILKEVAAKDQIPKIREFYS